MDLQRLRERSLPLHAKRCIWNHSDQPLYVSGFLEALENGANEDGLSCARRGMKSSYVIEMDLRPPDRGPLGSFYFVPRKAGVKRNAVPTGHLGEPSPL